jgi:hypothetical protein
VVFVTFILSLSSRINVWWYFINNIVDTGIHIMLRDDGLWQMLTWLVVSIVTGHMVLI